MKKFRKLKALILLHKDILISVGILLSMLGLMIFMYSISGKE